MSERHAGRSVFITGAGGGIGRETALRLAGEGARIMATDVNGDAAREKIGRAHV